MADIKISELPEATSISDNDVVPAVVGGVTKKAKAALFKGEHGEQGPQGVPGPQGEPGSAGPAGKDAELTAGSVTTEILADKAVTSKKVDWAELMTVKTGSNISDVLTFYTGFRFRGGSVVKIGKMVFANLIIEKTSGSFASVQDEVAMMNSDWRPNGSISINSYCVLSSNIYSAQSIGYLFIADKLIVSDPHNTNCNFVKISAFWETD